MAAFRKQIIIPLIWSALRYDSRYDICEGVSIIEMQEEYVKPIKTDEYWKGKIGRGLQHVGAALRIECDLFDEREVNCYELGLFIVFSIRIATGIPFEIPLVISEENDNHQSVQAFSPTSISTFYTGPRYRFCIDEGKALSGLEAIKSGFSEVLEEYYNSKTSSNIARAIEFASIGFQNRQIPIRIVNNTIFLEALFSSAKTEVGFQVASAVSWYLRFYAKPEERYELFEEIKKLYSLRSAIVHGGDVTNKIDEMEKILIFSEDLNTEIFQCILKNQHSKIFGMKNRQEELKKLCLGIPCKFTKQIE